MCNFAFNTLNLELYFYKDYKSSFHLLKRLGIQISLPHGSISDACNFAFNTLTLNRLYISIRTISQVSTY